MVTPTQQPLPTQRIPVTRTSHRRHASRCVFWSNYSSALETGHYWQPIRLFEIHASHDHYWRSFFHLFSVFFLSIAARHATIVWCVSIPRVPRRHVSPQSQPWRCRSRRRWSRRRRSTARLTLTLAGLPRALCTLCSPLSPPPDWMHHRHVVLLHSRRHMSSRYSLVPDRHSVPWCEAPPIPGPAWYVDASDALPSAVSLPWHHTGARVLSDDGLVCHLVVVSFAFVCVSPCLGP